MTAYCGAKYGKRPWPVSVCHLRPGHYGEHEAEAWDNGGTIRWTAAGDLAVADGQRASEGGDVIDAPSGWYVSDTHARRAIGYLSVELVQRGYLPGDFEMPILFEMWGQALEATMDVQDEVPSPIDDRAGSFVASEGLSPDTPGSPTLREAAWQAFLATAVRRSDVTARVAFDAGYDAVLAAAGGGSGADSDPFDKRGADRLADEVQRLIDRRVIDARSPAADALLDYKGDLSPADVGSGEPAREASE